MTEDVVVFVGMLWAMGGLLFIPSRIVLAYRVEWWRSWYPAPAVAGWGLISLGGSVLFTV